MYGYWKGSLQTGLKLYIGVLISIRLGFLKRILLLDSALNIKRRRHTHL